MFAVGKAHDCHACRIGAETHLARHREIASLVTEVGALDRNEVDGTPTRKIRAGDDADRTPNGRVQEVDHEQSDDEGEEEDATSTEPSTTSGASDSSNRTPLTKAEKRTMKKDVKFQRSTQRAAKSQQRHHVDITQRDIDKVARALHGESVQGSGHPLATDHEIEQVIERNRHFVASIAEHKVYLLRSIGRQRRANEEVKSRLRRSEGDDSISQDTETDALVDAVLVALDIAPISSTPASTKKRSQGDAFSTPRPAKRAALIQKIQVAIKEDMAVHENELRQTCIRAGGFWRYVGRPVFDRMTEIAKHIDWKTGTILDQTQNAHQEADGDIDMVDAEE